METPELLLICAIAFLVVFLILALLAFVMRLIMLVFPEKVAGADSAIIAAVVAAVHTVFPGTKITKLEER